MNMDRYSNRSSRESAGTSESRTKPSDFLEDHQVQELASLLGSIENSNYEQKALPAGSKRPPTSSSTMKMYQSIDRLPNASMSRSIESLRASSSLQGSPVRDQPDNSTQQQPSYHHQYFSSSAAAASTNKKYESNNNNSDDAASIYSSSDYDKSERSAHTVGGTQKLKNDQNNQQQQDEVDFTVIRYHTDYVIRSKNGKYFTTLQQSLQSGSEVEDDLLPMQRTASHNSHNSHNNHNNSITYSLGIHGQGIGDVCDSLSFIPLESKELPHTPIRYGSILAIKSSFAKERLLGVKDGSAVGFWRHVVGQGEKWMIMKANTPTWTTAAGGATAAASAANSSSSAGIAAGGSSSSNIGIEDITSRGRFIRLGDTILLQTHRTEHYLSLDTPGSAAGNGAGSGSSEVRLLYRERTGLGQEIFTLELFSSVPIPPWLLSRPYLNGRAISLPPAMKVPHLDAEMRMFPMMSLAASSHTAHAAGIFPLLPPPPLTDFTLPEQQLILLRELLVLYTASVEGQYIRIISSPGSSNTAGSSGSTSKQLKLTMDMDSMDRSLAGLISSDFFPIGEVLLSLRSYLLTHSLRYEYGRIHQAVTMQMKALLQELDVLLTQCEYLLTTQRLTLQKFLFLLQPAKMILTAMQSILLLISEQHGGQLVNTLSRLYLEHYGNNNHHGHDTASSASSSSTVAVQQVYSSCLQAACAPFLEMIATWIYQGILADPYKEFMIQEDSKLTKETLQEDFNAQYWENRYRLVTKHIPTMLLHTSSSHNSSNSLGHSSSGSGSSQLASNSSSGGSQLHSGLAYKALLAGKYLHVIQDCLGSSQGHSQASHSQGSYSSYGLGTSQGQGQAIANNQPILLPPPKKIILDMIQPSKTNQDHGKDKQQQAEQIMTVSLSQAIEETYHFSSQCLLQLLSRPPYALLHHLQMIQRYFLLTSGDFFITFMDLAEEELRKEVTEISVGRIQTLLATAVSNSSYNSSYSSSYNSSSSSSSIGDRLTCSLANQNLIQHLYLIQMAGEGSSGSGGGSSNSSLGAAAGGGGASTAGLGAATGAGSGSSGSSQGLKGMEAFTLDYQVTWPLTIILSRRAITKYQLLSRLLFFAKHVERRLLSTWMILQGSKEYSRYLPDQRSQSLLLQHHHLRHRMLHFIQNLVYYMTLEVIHPHRVTLEEDLASLEEQSSSSVDGSYVGSSVNSGIDMDQVIELHEKFLDVCLKECLLASQELLKILMKCMSTCVMFADTMNRWMDIQTTQPSSASGGGATEQQSRHSLRGGAGRSAASQASPAVMIAGHEDIAANAAGAATLDEQQQAKKNQRMKDQQTQRQQALQQQARSLQREIAHESFARILKKFSHTFDSQLKEFLDHLWSNSYRHHAQLANLCTRLDYNGYYTSQFATGSDREF